MSSSNLKTGHIGFNFRDKSVLDYSSVLSWNKIVYDIMSWMRERLMTACLPFLNNLLVVNTCRGKETVSSVLWPPTSFPSSCKQPITHGSLSKPNGTHLITEANRWYEKRKGLLRRRESMEVKETRKGTRERICLYFIVSNPLHLKKNHVYLHACEWMHTLQFECGSQRTAIRFQLSPSTLWASRFLT